MSYWALILIAIGSVAVIVSLANLRHSPTSTNYIAVHQNMDSERIAEQLKRGPHRVDAVLGVKFGAAFIALGIAWQLVLHFFWI